MTSRLTNLRSILCRLGLLFICGWIGCIATATGVQALTNSPPALPANTPSSAEAQRRFEAANKLYEQSKFTEAAAEYDRLLSTGRASAALYYNLGNAWFKAGQIGRAIAAYLRAERLSPRDPDVIANLKFARNQTGGATLRSNWLQNLFSRLSLNEWTWLAMGFGWLWAGTLAATLLRPQWRTSLRKILWAAAAGTVMASGCLLAAFQSSSAHTLAVVIVPQAQVRHGPLEESQAAFTVRDGAELKVLDAKDGWLRVAAGQSGWIERNKVLLVGRQEGLSQGGS